MLGFELLGMGLGTDVKTCDRVKSSQLDERLGLPQGTVEAQSGVQERWVLKSGISQSAFAAYALKACAQNATVALDTVDLLMATAAVPQQAIPNTASLIAHELGLSGMATLDINASCLGFVVSLYQAMALLQTGAYQRIALVASDRASAGLNWQHLHASAIFGDGAVGVIIQRPDGSLSQKSGAGVRFSCLAFASETYPEGSALCEVRAGGTRVNPQVGMRDSDFFFDMDGKGIFKLAMQHTERFTDTLLRQAGLDYRDIDCVIMHQASHLGMKHTISRLKFRPETIVNIYAHHGNQVSASIPTALYHAYQQGILKPNTKLALLGTAAGFSIGGMILEVVP